MDYTRCTFTTVNRVKITGIINARSKNARSHNIFKLINFGCTCTPNVGQQ